MAKVNHLFRNIRVIFMLGLVLTLTNSCETADEILSNALDFEGVFQAGDGWEITLEEDADKEGKATINKVGTPRSSATFNGGESAGFGLVPIGDNTWKGYAWDQTFRNLYADSKIKIDGNTLTIMPNGAAAYSFTKTSGTGTGTGTNPGTGTTGTGGGQIIINQMVDGNIGDKKYVRFNVPTGVKQMVVKTTEGTDPNVFYRNTADLFVRRGTDPTVSNVNYNYIWTADCASIEVNRIDEVCTFNNPASGQWTALIYGYNTYFSSNLIVTIYK